MKKGKSSSRGALRANYKRADFRRGLVRGKYAGRVATGPNVVRLDPETAAAFPTSAAVNRALAKVLREAKSRRSLKSDLKKVDAHSIRPKEYRELPSLTPRQVTEGVVRKAGRQLRSADRLGKVR